MNVRQLDLNLLVVLDAIYSEGGITAAARRLHVTQPAVTHALNRLREHFGDPLFVREGRQMVPTPMARNLIRPLKRSLRSIEIMLHEVDRFDPATTPRRFSLGVRDVLESVLLPPLMRSITQNAPLVDLDAVQTSRRSLASDLDSGALDAAIDVLLPLPDSIHRQRIVFDRFVVVARKGHPDVGANLSLATYLAQDHVLATVRRSGGGMEDMSLAQLGQTRRVRLRCQHYFAACRVVSQTNLVLTMPENYARVANAGLDNQVLPAPVDMTPLDGYLYWHRNVENDPANQWFRSQVLGALPVVNPPDSPPNG
ncbi:MAG: LysR family transcriptional regulator [Pseudomonadota bacterium]|nr:LysR family transcriptional regulator [Pseudomonadota bacterium]